MLCCHAYILFFLYVFGYLMKYLLFPCAGALLDGHKRNSASEHGWSCHPCQYWHRHNYSWRTNWWYYFLGFILYNLYSYFCICLIYTICLRPRAIIFNDWVNKLIRFIFSKKFPFFFRPVIKWSFLFLLLLQYEYSGLVQQNVVLFSKFGLVVKNMFAFFLGIWILQIIWSKLFTLLLPFPLTCLVVHSMLDVLWSTVFIIVI